MQSQVFTSIMMPFFGTALGSACVLFMKNRLNPRSVTKGADWVCGGGHGGCFHLEPAGSCHGAVGFHGAVGIRACGDWFLVWHPVPAAFEPDGSPSAYEQQ